MKMTFIILIYFSSVLIIRAQSCAVGYKHLSDSVFKAGDVIKVEGIYFDFNAFRLLPESFGCVEEIAIFSEKHPQLVFEFGEHSGIFGSSAYLEALSKRRAQAVKDLLVDVYHADTTLIKVRGYGDTEPLWPEDETDQIMDEMTKIYINRMTARWEVKIIRVLQ